MSLYKENGLTYSGAGVIIIEDYYTKSGTIEPSLVLVKNRASGLFMDFGGSYEKKQSNLKQTAQKELKEESLNLFDISEKHFKKYVDIPAGKSNFYRVYVIKINGISKKYFNHNRKLFNELHKKGVKIPKSWKETEEITHIPFKNIDFNLLGAKGDIVVSDIDGKNVRLHSRAKKCIYYAQATLFNMSQKNPIAKKKNIVKNKSADWTNNSYTYKII